jgi:hypothetical protein
MRIKTEQLAQKQQLERNALKQKHDSEYESTKKQREADLEKLNLKFKNRKLDLEMQQKNEKNLNQNDNLLKASKNILYLFYSLIYKKILLLLLDYHQLKRILTILPKNSNSILLNLE